MMQFINFEENKYWFDIKLLVECGSKNVNKAVTDQTYARTITKLCKELQIVADHKIHIGRAAGEINAELNELDGAQIKVLGNWNVGVMEDRYSTKLPLKPLRAMGGHGQEKGHFFIFRAGIEPSEELQSKVFPFVDEELLKKMTVRSDGTIHATAVGFLRLLKRLRCILLQDAIIDSWFL
jgi:hypothetical protein